MFSRNKLWHATQREREREGLAILTLDPARSFSVCVCVCVHARARARARACVCVCVHACARMCTHRRDEFQIIMNYLDITSVPFVPCYALAHR